MRDVRGGLGVDGVVLETGAGAGAPRGVWTFVDGLGETVVLVVERVAVETFVGGLGETVVLVVVGETVVVETSLVVVETSLVVVGVGVLVETSYPAGP